MENLIEDITKGEFTTSGMGLFRLSDWYGIAIVSESLESSQALANIKLICEAFNVANQTKMSPLQLKNRVEELEKALAIVHEMAEWSAKYPRGGIYSMNSPQDKELIAIEDRATEYIKSLYL